MAKAEKFEDLIVWQEARLLSTYLQRAEQQRRGHKRATPDNLTT